MAKQTNGSFKLKPHHVAINVADIEASISWYCGVLGFAVARRNFYSEPKIAECPLDERRFQHRDFPA